MMRPCLPFLLILAACSPPPESVREAEFSLEVGTALGGDDTEGFLRAEAPRSFSFPEDHALHPGYRNEWWYLTGNLFTEEGRHFGYQVTFFSTALNGAIAQIEGWQSPRIWMAHAAVTDVESQNHTALERFSRENPGLAGNQSNPFKVWLENWSLTSNPAGQPGFPWQLNISDEAFTLNLQLEPLKAPVLQGDQGLSQKSPEPGNASYYYSMSRLASRGSLEIGGQVFELNGTSWLDREWSTSALADDQSGWDWFSLQFHDGQELMYYQLRDNNGKAHPSSDGNWTSVDALQTRISPAEVTLQEQRSWTAPNGVSYSTEWLLAYRDQRWIIRALVEDQFMALSVPYWEGAVEILDSESSVVLGYGYLEMVRTP